MRIIGSVVCPSKWKTSRDNHSAPEKYKAINFYVHFVVLDGILYWVRTSLMYFLVSFKSFWVENQCLFGSILVQNSILIHLDSILCSLWSISPHFFIILMDSWLFHSFLCHFNPIFSQFSSCCFGQERNSRLSENNFELVSQLSGSLKLSIIYKPDEWSKTKIEYLQTWRIILRTIQLLSGVKSQKAKVSSWDYFSLISTN